MTQSNPLLRSRSAHMPIQHYALIEDTCYCLNSPLSMEKIVCGTKQWNNMADH